MKRYFPVILATILTPGIVLSQSTTPSPTPQPRPATPVQQRPGAAFEVSDFGVDFQTDQRLIVVMAALEAAGLDSVPAGRQPSTFRARLRKDLATLDPELREKLRNFYERNKLAAPASPAEQAARYVSLALALGPAPSFESPPRSEDLPGGLLEVLDFTPLVQEF
jgi:hypothetical protein